MKQTLVISFMTIVVATLVMCLSFSALHAVYVAVTTGDELSIPMSGIYILAATTLCGMMAFAVSAIKIASVMWASFRRRRAATVKPSL